MDNSQTNYRTNHSRIRNAEHKYVCKFLNKSELRAWKRKTAGNATRSATGCERFCSLTRISVNLRWIIRHVIKATLSSFPSSLGSSFCLFHCKHSAAFCLQIVCCLPRAIFKFSLNDNRSFADFNVIQFGCCAQQLLSAVCQLMHVISTEYSNHFGFDLVYLHTPGTQLWFCVNCLNLKSFVSSLCLVGTIISNYYQHHLATFYFIARHRPKHSKKIISWHKSHGSDKISISSAND